MYAPAPRPRLCHVRRWPNFNGFGFNLHAERNKVGQFIGKVDPDSPAEAAGLHEHDRIIEVNYVPISNDSHKEVVLRIKQGVERENTFYPDEVILLVLDPEAADYYSNRGTMPKSFDANVDHLEAEDRSAPIPTDVPPSYETNLKNGAAQPGTPTKRGESNPHYKNVTDFTGPTVTQTSTRSSTPVASKPSRRNEEAKEEEDYLEVNLPSGSASALHDSPSTGSKSPMTPPPSYSPPSAPFKPSHSGAPRTPPPQSSAASRSKIPALDMTAAEMMEKVRAEGARKKAARQRNTMTIQAKHAFIEKL